MTSGDTAVGHVAAVMVVASRPRLGISQTGPATAQLLVPAAELIDGASAPALFGEAVIAVRCRDAAQAGLLAGRLADGLTGRTVVVEEGVPELGEDIIQQPTEVRLAGAVGCGREGDEELLVRIIKACMADAESRYGPAWDLW